MSDTELIDNAISKLTGGVRELWVGYDKKKHMLVQFRSMTEQEVMALNGGDRVWFEANDGTAKELKINGKIRTWKRQPERVEIPVKYGLYEFGTMDLVSAKTRLLVRMPQ